MRRERSVISSGRFARLARAGRLRLALTVALMLLPGCGPPKNAGRSPRQASDDLVECYVWRGQDDGGRPRPPGWEDVYELVLYPDRTYRALLHFRGGPSTMDSFDAGRWAAKDGWITFVPEIWTDASMWRRYFWTPFVPGESLEWATEPQMIEDPPGSGRFASDQSKPPKTVRMKRVPCGDLPQRAQRAAEDAWASYLELSDRSPFRRKSG